MNDLTKNILLWVVIVMVMVVVFSRYVPTGAEPTQVSYSTVLDDVRNGRVEAVTLRGDEILLLGRCLRLRLDDVDRRHRAHFDARLVVLDELRCQGHRLLGDVDRLLQRPGDQDGSRENLPAAHSRMGPAAGWGE